MKSLALVVLITASLEAAPISNPPKDAQAHSWAVIDKALQDGNSDQRQEALAALATLGESNAEAVKRAVAALQDKHVFVRRAAALALGELQARSAIPDLEKALDDSPEVSLAAAESLTLLGDAKGRDVLTAVVGGERKDGPGMLTNAMRKGKQELHHPESLLLMGTQDAAGAMFGPAGMVIPAVKDAASVKGKSAPGRVAAVAYLAKYPDDYAIQLLEWALKDENREVCLQAEKELGARGNGGSIEKLEPLLNDDHSRLRLMAAASIIRISDRDGRSGEVPVGPVVPVTRGKK